MPSSHHAHEDRAVHDRHSDQRPRLTPMNHSRDRHLFSNRDDVARHDVRRGQLTEVVARIHHPQQVEFTHQTDTRPIVFHDREAPTVSLSHDVGDGGSLRPRADREDRVLETTTA
jgi:hypothetical protein